MSDHTPSDRHARCELIVVGGSAGALEALLDLVRGLRSPLRVPMLVVIHIAPNVKSLLPELLTRAGPIPVVHPRDGDLLTPGKIYVAPPDHHLLVAGVRGAARIRLNVGPRENHSRPAVDPLFRSAALVFGAGTVGVILSGALSDGTAGLWSIKQQGGVAIVQDPGDALYRSMPHSAMDQVQVDHVVTAREIPALLMQLVDGRQPNDNLPSDNEQERVEMPSENPLQPTAQEIPGSSEVMRDISSQISGNRDGQLSVFVCPDCGGSLWQVDAGSFPRFRCHVGHVYGGPDLLQGYRDNVERALWTTIRALRDKARLTRQLSGDAQERGDLESATRYAVSAGRDDERADTIEQMARSGD